MPDLSIDFCGLKSPNPFWLASAPPTNTGEQIMRAFDEGWGGAVWKTLGKPIINVSSRFGGLSYQGKRLMGLNNIELITDRPLEVNFREIAEVKKRYPKNIVVVSLMVETKEEWHDMIKRSEDAGGDALELNFGCPHGMCERGMGSAVGQEPELLTTITSWVKEYATVPVIVKLTPNISDIREPGLAAKKGGADAVSLINTIKSIMGVDLDRMLPMPVVGDASTNGGYCGPAVKPIALHMVAELARLREFNLPISAIGGVANFRDAAEFMALGAETVQVCTAVMHYGYRIVRDMLDGLELFLKEKQWSSLKPLIGSAVKGFKEWGELDLNHHVVARIDKEKCIGCQLCYVACLDGSHQCIYLPNMTEAEALKKGHSHIPQAVIKRSHVCDTNSPESRIPFVDEDACVGCNLCELICPVDGCITMVDNRTSKIRRSFKDYSGLTTS